MASDKVAHCNSQMMQRDSSWTIREWRLVPPSLRTVAYCSGCLRKQFESGGKWKVAQKGEVREGEIWLYDTLAEEVGVVE
jgi:hypothetical protein